MREFTARLRASHYKNAPRLGTAVEQLCAGEVAQDLPSPTASPRLAPVGSPLVLYRLKRTLGIATADPEPAVIPIGPDGFEMPTASTLRDEHEQLTGLLQEIASSPPYHTLDLRLFPKGRALYSLDPAPRGRMLLAAVERYTDALLTPLQDYTDQPLWRVLYAIDSIAHMLAS